MRQREFMGFLGGAAASWPVVVRAQQSPMPVIGYLDPRSRETLADRPRAFRQGLKQTGYVEGENVNIEYRWARGENVRLPALAAELVAHQVSVIVAISANSALAAKAATKTIPIVFMMGDDPVQFGLVDSLNRPGGNVTGVSFVSPALEAKSIELLRELVPKATMIAVLVNPNFPAAEIRMRDARSAAAALGLQLSLVNASSEHEIETAFATLSSVVPAHSSCPPIEREL